MATRLAVGQINPRGLEHRVAAQFRGRGFQAPLRMVNLTEPDAVGLARGKKAISFRQPMIQCSWLSDISFSRRRIGCLELRCRGFLVIARAFVINGFAY